MLLFVLGWGLIGWLGRKLLAIDIGWKANFAPWMLLLGGVVAGLFSILSTARWLRSSKTKSNRVLVRTDLSNGVVLEERLKFAEAKKFQEPEHGGLIYFLHTADDRVLVLYDHESQDLGVDDQDPLSSSFQPKTDLLLVRAPHSHLVITRTFTGEPLVAGRISEMIAAPKLWPETDEFFDVPWADLESRFARAV
jgi:hypothetical protein